MIQGRPPSEVVPTTKPTNPSAERFAALAARLADNGDGSAPHREGFGTGSLFVGKKKFAVLDASGALVLKLSPERVQELIRTGVGVGRHPGSGTPLKEYLSVGAENHPQWLALAREARAYMGSKK
jgi:hypothetical protein